MKKTRQKEHAVATSPGSGKTEMPANITAKDRERFWVKVDKEGSLQDQDRPHYAGIGPCWEWTAACYTTGYGAFGLCGKMWKAHRFAWMMENGDIPVGLCILHKCDNPKCVNPAHLFFGSQADNMADKTQKGRGAIGSDHGKAKLAESDALEIRKVYVESGRSQMSLAQEHGVSQQQISRIINRKQWAHL